MLSHGIALALDDGVMSESSLEPSTRIAVLVVEDDPAMRAVLTDHLTRDGFDVIEEATAEGAIGPRMPVIIVTAFGGPHIADEAFERGAWLVSAS